MATMMNQATGQMGIGSKAARTVNIYPSPLDIMCPLDSPDDLYGLLYRFAAVKSLKMVHEVLESVRPRLEKVAGMKDTLKRSNIAEFYDKVDHHMELESVLFRSIAESLLKLDSFVERIAKCKWDIESMEADIKCNDYVHGLLTEYRTFFDRLKSEELQMMPEDIRRVLIESAITTGMKVVVEGFSRVKKCTTEGRVKMAFDVKKFQMGLQDLTSLRPIPAVGFVEAYVGGYMEFVGATDTAKVLEWVTKHVHAYSEEQVKNLLTVSYIEFNKLKRKQRDELLKQVEQTYKEVL